MKHGICVVGGFRFQPGAPVVPLQQAQPFQAATYTLTDDPNQIFELVFIRCLDALNPRWSVIAIDVNTIQKQGVKIDVEVEACSDAVPSEVVSKSPHQFRDH